MPSKSALRHRGFLLRTCSRSSHSEALENRICLTAINFDPPANLNLSAVPQFVVSADFNRDGRTDLMASSYAGQQLSLLLGVGDGTFQPATDISLSEPADSLAAADLNADSKSDIVVVHYNAGTVDVMLGLGDGTFAQPIAYPAGTGPRASVVADFNGDGKVDLVLAKSFDKNLTFLRGNGNGTFQAPQNTSLGYTPSDIAAGDFNSDDKVDLAVVDFFSDKAHILVNNGSGGFTSTASVSTGGGPTSVAVGDFDGDGKLDLASANFLAGNVSVLRGNGSGGLLTAVNYATGSGATYITTADLDGDDSPDLLSINSNADSMSALQNNGNGGFQSALNFAVLDQPRSAVVVDVNGDLLSDVAVAHEGVAKLALLIGTLPSAPISRTGGPYNVSEGGNAQLDGSTSSGTNIIYRWDLDGDGVFGETGANAACGNENVAKPTFSAANLDGPSSRTVRLRVIDSFNRSSTSTTTVNVGNVPPTLTMSGGTAVVVGAPYTLQLSATDPGNDTVSQWVITWGDGDVQTVSGNPSLVTHAYASVSDCIISASASDEDGTYAANSIGVSVTATDQVAPIATLVSALKKTTASTAGYRFVVQYTDDLAINVSTINGNDILVTGPNGYARLATVYSVGGTATARSVTYQVAAPAGGWGFLANGAYSVALRANEVFDTSGHAAQASTLGAFLVRVPAPADYAGGTFASARSFGLNSAGATRAVEDFIGAADRNDYYRFSIPAGLNINVRMTNLTANADMLLLDGNGVRVAMSRLSGNANETISRYLRRGTYFLRVYYTGSTGSFYRLRLAFTAVT